MREQLQTLIDEYRAKRRELEAIFYENGQDQMQKFFDEFFEKNPEVESIHWVQYTPYFNDGSPCVFSVGDMYATLKGDKVDGDEGSCLYLGDWVDDHIKKGSTWAIEAKEEYERAVSLVGSEDRLREINEEVSSLERYIGSIEDFMCIIYDDHSMITVKPGSTEVVEYEHD